MISEKQHLDQLISEANKTIISRDACIADLSKNVSILQDEARILNGQKSALETDLNNTRETLGRLTFQKDELNRLLMKSQEGERILAKKINDMFNSETHRFIVRPIWKVLDFIKALFRLHDIFGMHVFKIFYRRFLLILILTGFVIFIVFPIKIKKLFTR
jgi:hypothetical protein